MTDLDTSPVPITGVQLTSINGHTTCELQIDGKWVRVISTHATLISEYISALGIRIRQQQSEMPF